MGRLLTWRPSLRYITLLRSHEMKHIYFFNDSVRKVKTHTYLLWAKVFSKYRACCFVCVCVCGVLCVVCVVCCVCGVCGCCVWCYVCGVLCVVCCVLYVWCVVCVVWCVCVCVVCACVLHSSWRTFIAVTSVVTLELIAPNDVAQCHMILGGISLNWQCRKYIK